MTPLTNYYSYAHGLLTSLIMMLNAVQNNLLHWMCLIILWLVCLCKRSLPVFLLASLESTIFWGSSSCHYFYHCLFQAFDVLHGFISVCKVLNSKPSLLYKNSVVGVWVMADWLLWTTQVHWMPRIYERRAMDHLILLSLIGNEMPFYEM